MTPAPVRVLTLSLAAFTVGVVLLLRMRSPVGPTDEAALGATLPLLLMPAAIAIVGLARSSMPLVGAAGALCLLPALLTGFAVIPFAGFLAIAGFTGDPMPSGRDLLRGIAVTIVGTAAWILPFLGVGPDGSVDGVRQGLAVGMVVVTIALAIGRPVRPRIAGLAR